MQFFYFYSININLVTDGSDESIPRSYENIEINDENTFDDFNDSFSDSSFDQEITSPDEQVRKSYLSDYLWNINCFNSCKQPEMKNAGCTTIYQNLLE